MVMILLVHKTGGLYTFSLGCKCFKLKMRCYGLVCFQDSERVVSKQEGIAFARQFGCLFFECSAKTQVNVEYCFEELVQKILDTPSLSNDTNSARKNILRPGQPSEIDVKTSVCC